MHVVILMALLLTAASAFAQEQSVPARGPLSVHPTNSRYFTDGTKNPDGSLKAVYLTGAHTWNNLADTGPADPPPAFDFDTYLDFLDRHHHNFIRLWRKEEGAWDTRLSPEYVEQGMSHTVAPFPWARTGPGNALDGKPKFDLRQFDPAYFTRLRSRVEAAGRRGIYVSVMLFEGWELQHLVNSWKDHPFHRDNNVNEIDGDLNGDGFGIETHTLDIPAVTRIQEVYVRHVIDTVGDLDNVLYEVSNESGSYSTKWQYHMIRFMKEYEKTRAKQHPVGMTFQWSRNRQHRGMNQSLFDSPADWISPSPNAVDGRKYQSDPPSTDGRKVILLDTDHLWGIGGDSDWVWKTFTRGYYPLFMDPYENAILGKVPPAHWDSIRLSLGQTRHLAERVDLASMNPREDLASTNYCLAQPNVAYLAYLPTGGEVTIDLTAATGSFQVEWMAPVEGTITHDEPVTGGATQQLTTPFQGPAVLVLSKSR